MSETNQTKICPHCDETIRAAAKVCPHCRYWQKKWSWQNPRIMATVWALICSVAFLCLVAFVGKVFGPEEQFAIYRDEIGVVSSQFSQRFSGSNMLVTVVGTLTNRSNIGWKDVGVEAQFLDKAGKAFDVITVDADYYRGVVVLPHGETAFKIEGKAARPESNYENYKLTVRWAKDVSAWP